MCHFANFGQSWICKNGWFLARAGAKIWYSHTNQSLDSHCCKKHCQKSLWHKATKTECNKLKLTISDHIKITAIHLQVSYEVIIICWSLFEKQSIIK